MNKQIVGLLNDVPKNVNYSNIYTINYIYYIVPIIKENIINK